MGREVRKMKAMELFRETFEIRKRFEEIKYFHGILPFNNTEIQLMYAVMEAGERGERVISSDLARSLGITRSAVSQMVNKLVKRDVVCRVPDEHDKKIAYIELTEHSQKVCETMKTLIGEFMQSVVRRLGEDGVEHFFAVSTAFFDAFDEGFSELQEKIIHLRDQADKE